ncbi:peritrophin-1-like [Onthophagus taurus]|uniref:peritrophin-1-like n=1 Tax=Onthophagus taurus TaxID=166361 RepID=UPI0039BDECC6
MVAHYSSKMIVSVLIISVLAVTSYGHVITSCPPYGSITIPHPRNFGTFLQCVNGTAYEVNCPDGYLFNANQRFCYDPKDLVTAANSKTIKGYYKCNDGEGCSPQLPCPNYPHCSSYPDYSYCPGYPGYPGYGHPVGECPICNDMCEVHMLPDETDCSVFYMCDWGCPIWQRCPRGLHFNTYLKVCDYPWRAGCSNSGSTSCQ